MMKVTRGEIDSLGLLFERHHKHIYNFLYNMSGDRILSEDITQEVFFRLLKYRHSYNGGKFLSWLFTIARNTLSTYHRQNTENFLPLEVVHYKKPYEEIEDDEQDNFVLLQKALNGLEPADRELLLLSKVKDLNHKEIANILGSTTGAVRTRTCRALKKLKEIYFKN